MLPLMLNLYTSLLGEAARRAAANRQRAGNHLGYIVGR